jgi:putative heme-binding domain-containing protein
LERLGELDPKTLSQLASDSDRLVRVHAVKLRAEHPKLSDEERRRLQRSLDDPDAFVRRAAADALGRHPRPDQISILLAGLQKAPLADAALVHTLRIALRDHLKNHQEAFGGQYAATDLPRIADVALGVPTPQAADFTIGYLKDVPDRSRIYEMVNHAIRRCSDSRIDLAMEVVSRYEREKASWPEQNAAVRAAVNGFAQRGTPVRPRLSEWIDRLAGAQLAVSDVKALQQGLELVRDLKIASAFKSSAAFTKPETKFVDLRPLALDAAAAANPDAAVEVLRVVLENAKEPAEIRRKAGENLGSLSHLPAARAVMIAHLPVASYELAGVIARGLSRGEESAKELARLFDERKISALLARDPEIDNNLRRAKLPDFKSRREKWLKDAPSEDAALAKLLEERRKWATAAGAEVKSGEAVFTKHCGVCHQMAGKGAKIGPQLDGVGVRDVDRLLEDLLAPSRNVDQAFRTTQLSLHDGRTVSGLFLRDDGAVLVLADSQGKEQRYEKSAVEERRISPVSPMPADVGTRLTQNELRDLIAFLHQQRTQPKKQP